MAHDPNKGQNVDPAEYRVPRNFKLLAELEGAEKGLYSDVQKYGEDCSWITLGLDGPDATFTHWNASIIPHQGGHIGDRIYSLKITTGPGYPDDPPLIKFVQKVDIPCVDNRGIVCIFYLSLFFLFKQTKKSDLNFFCLCQTTFFFIFLFVIIILNVLL